jgi:alkane 1-monooxygenase
MPLFAAATLTPLVLLALGGLTGGAGWLWAGLAYLTLFTALADRLAPPATPGLPEETEFPAGNGLLVALGLAHLALMPLAVWAIAGPSALGPAERLIAALGFGLAFGQISVPAAHELIHRGSRRLYRLGVAIYVTLLFGHHASAHRLVHHVHVATPRDPNTARRGESLYAFLPRAWIGSFRAGLAAEDRRHGAGLHPYAVYLGGSAACLGLALLIAGPAGALVWALLGLHATAQLLMSDYVQHYGLTRAVLADGRVEPVSHRHSWNAPQAFSARMMLNAPRHSDHHARPARPYPALTLPADAPILPRSLPVMATLALFPGAWRRVMHPRLAALGSRRCDPCGTGAPTADLAP